MPPDSVLEKKGSPRFSRSIACGVSSLLVSVVEEKNSSCEFNWSPSQSKMDDGRVDKRNSIVITEREINDGDSGEFDVGEELEAQSVTESIQEEIENEGGSIQVEKAVFEEEEEEQVKSVSFEVRTPSGKKFMLNDINLETTVTEIKEIIAKQDDNYTVATIKLIKTGKVLSDDLKTVGELGIKNGSVVHMVKKLAGAVKNDGHTPNYELKTTDAQDRGFLTIRIPPNARPGMKLILNPPGRSERLFVTVPRGYSPGDTLRVRLPEERQEAPPFTAPLRQVEHTQTRGTGLQSSFQESSRNQKMSNLMKVRCPANATPGSDIQIEVPGKGRMKVKVPNTVRPGDYFYFRVMT